MDGRCHSKTVFTSFRQKSSVERYRKIFKFLRLTYLDFLLPCISVCMAKDNHHISKFKVDQTGTLWTTQPPQIRVNVLQENKLHV